MQNRQTWQHARTEFYGIRPGHRLVKSRAVNAGGMQLIRVECHLTLNIRVYVIGQTITNAMYGRYFDVGDFSPQLQDVHVNRPGRGEFFIPLYLLK